ncbi:UNVERIFIED_CONTAM: hypothetical protein Sradi_2428600 [Sesamum radiatum]|uniref:Uncharacterized protein n=1 Tax=Sesamum radiatum TaxID=300843 RepID=A0AAW2SK06_SESRA
MANSPFSAGVNGLRMECQIRYGGCEGSGNFLVGTEPCMARSISVHGCSEMLSQSSLPRPPGFILILIPCLYEKYDDTEDAANNISRAVSRRDMATQMSPESSIQSSPRRLSSFSLATPSILPVAELQSTNTSRPDIRDVPVDERVTMTRWSKKNRGKTPGRGSRNADDWKRKAVNIRSATWEVSAETSKSISK